MLDKKVAVCISGALRGDLSELKLIKKNIIEPLNADVYFSTWDCYYKWPGICAANNIYVWRNFGSVAAHLIPKAYQDLNGFSRIFPNVANIAKQPVICELPLEDVRKILNPKKINICSQNDFATFVKDFVLPECTDIWVNQLKMFYLMYVCNSNVINAEKEFNCKYDYTIRIRPDVQINKKMEITQLSTISDNSILVDLGNYGVQDQVFAAHTNVMNKVCSIWLEIVRTKRLSFFKDFPSARSHVLMGLWCVKNLISCDPSYVWGRQMNSCSANSIPDLRESLDLDLNGIKDNELKKSVQPFYEHMMKTLNARYGAKS